MANPRALIFSGYGLNCEEETAFAFETAGAKADIVHINNLIDQPHQLKQYQILAFPGGFSYGDDTGSGKAFANKLRNHLWSQLETFARQDHLIIGVCNGFQILSNLGLLPAPDGTYGQKQSALVPNDSARYTVRWVDLVVESNSPWLSNIKQLSMPVAHGEGKLYADPDTLKTLNQQNQVALRYTKGEICDYLQLPASPNGSLEDIAGVTDPTGRILGLMPHPERATAFTHQPHWPLLKQKLVRKGKSLPKTGPGIQIFQNAVKYFK